MFRSQPKEGTPAYKSKGYPDRSNPRCPIQRLPVLLPTLDSRAGPGADSSWWRDHKSQRLPCGSPESPHAPRSRGTARALLLPPLLPSSSAREAGTRGNRQPTDRDNPDALGTLLGELLPNKFRHFLHQLCAKSTDSEADREAAAVGGGVRSLGFPGEDRLHLTGLSSSRPLAAPSAPQHPRNSTPEHCLASRCSSCSFLPDLW